ncbi:MAG: phospho-sugar mutase [Oligoflexus sp.]
MERDISKLANYWASAEVFDMETRNEIKTLVDKQEENELAERFYKDLEFGTGGLRGILGAGSSRMNIYNVRKASQAFADYLNEFFHNEKERRIAISYDNRRFSREFAEATAEVMAANGIHSYLTKELRPTPVLSFMVRHFQCHGGICVTASHNPPNYNGYKVYWQTGGQIVPPHDQKVIQRYLAMESYEVIKHISFADGLKKGLIHEVGKELDEVYFSKVLSLATGRGDKNIKIVFTPLHGTGGYPIAECLKRYGFHNVSIVPEQAKPDSEFPTVRFPNPEDPEALEMAIALGKKENADLIMATDPDTDRIGMVVRDGDDYMMLNGNQIGCLLTDFLLNSYQASGRLPKNPLVVKTIVTTDMQAKIATHYGAECLETLTGFKWICQLVEDLETGKVKPYREYVCGGEESYGFLAGSFVRDKDAVSAFCLAAEMVASFKEQGKTVSQVLDELYRRHGVYLEHLHTVTLPGRVGAAKIQEMMDTLRQDPPKIFAGVSVKKCRDFQNSQEMEQKDSQFVRSGSIDLPSSNVLQFILEDGSKISARPSGTEPKIKFYFSVHQEPDSGIDLDTMKKACQDRLQQLISTFVKLAES